MTNKIEAGGSVTEVSTIEELVALLPENLLNVLRQIPDSVLVYDATTSEGDDYLVRTQKQKSQLESTPDQESGT